jgi:hypothetical protein
MVIVPQAPLSPLIIELKHEHVAILKAMEEMKREIVGGGQGGVLMAVARDRLLAHLKKEDDQLYGVLHAKARDDATLARTLNVFAADMQEISGFAVAFFAKFGTQTPSADAARDFGKLFGLLGNRIRREEIILYPAYDLAVQKRPPSRVPPDRVP